MTSTQFWTERMDHFKKLRRDNSQDPHLRDVYGRYEMVMRAEVEMADAEEKASAKKGGL